MEQSFEKQLRVYSELKREEANAGDKSLEEIRSQLKKAKQEATKKFKTGGSEGKNNFRQDNIVRIQKKKQEVMKKLEKDLELLDEQQDKWLKQKNEESVIFTGKHLRLKKNGEIITEGEILTDIDWGLKYSLRPKLPDLEVAKYTVPRTVRKRYLIELAKRELKDLLDDQIAEQKTSPDVRKDIREDDRKEDKPRDYIKWLAEHRASEDSGKIAERMIVGLLRKISIDDGEDFEVEKGDFADDNDLKSDLFISRKGSGGKIGVDFTTNIIEYNIKKDRVAGVKESRSKELAENNITDIMVIYIDLPDIQKNYQAWKQNKKPGGPDKLWRAETKRMIFSEIMKKTGILTEEEISKYIEKIK